MSVEQPLSDLLVYSARPHIWVNERRHDRTNRLLLAMKMTEQESGMSALELRYSNVASHEDGSASLAFESADSSLQLGAEIKVGAGDQEAPMEIFRGMVTAIEAEFSQEGPPELVVLAEDALQRARMHRRTRMHRSATIASLAQDVATQASLRLQVSGFTENIGDQYQLNESDLAFLRRLLRDYDGDLQVVEDALVVTPRGTAHRGEVVIELFGQLTRVRITADLADQVTAVSLSGWDENQAQPIRLTSEGGGAWGPGTGRRGADVLASALTGGASGGRVEHLGFSGTLNPTEARAMADASFDQRARRFVIAEGTAEGNPNLRVGAHVSLRGVSPRFDNTYYVTRACHRFDVSSGYSTDFEAECAYLGGAS